MSILGALFRALIGMAFGACLGMAMREGMNGWAVAGLGLAYLRALVADPTGTPRPEKSADAKGGSL